MAPALPASRPIVIALALALLPGAFTDRLQANEQAPQPNVVVLPETLEASPAYLRIQGQLIHAGEAMTGSGTGGSDTLRALRGVHDLSDLDAMLDQQTATVDTLSFILDTGASGHVVSRGTIRAFDIPVEHDAVYHETGLHGETAMGVTAPLTLGLRGSPRGGDPDQAWHRVGDDVRLLINKSPTNALTKMVMGEINIVGMPAIRDFIVEVDPEPLTRAQALMQDLPSEMGRGGADLADLGHMLDDLEGVGGGPTVVLHDRLDPGVEFDYVLDLEYRDYSRHENPDDRGPKPDLSPNPVVTGLRMQLDGHVAEGDWLLDTGAPVSMISTETAKALGLYDEQGEPTRRAAFSVPLGGVGGGFEQIPGFVLDHLDVETADGTVLRWPRPRVLVKDISTRLDSGEVITLDGIFGTNLLLPTMGGLGGALGLPDMMATMPFRKFYIDGPRRRLLLEAVEPEDLARFKHIQTRQDE